MYFLFLSLIIIKIQKIVFGQCTPSTHVQSAVKVQEDWKDVVAIFRLHRFS